MELEFSTDQDELRDSIRAVLAKESPVGLARRVVDDGDTARRAVGDAQRPRLARAHRPRGRRRHRARHDRGRHPRRGDRPGHRPRAAARDRDPVRPRRARGRDSPNNGPASSARSPRASVRGPSRSPSGAARSIPRRSTATYVVDGADVVLAGEKRFVVEGDAVDELVVVARAAGSSGDDGVRAIVVPASAARTTPVHSLDGSLRFAHVDLDGVRVERDRILGAEQTPSSTPALRRALEEATVATALEIVGTAQTIFDVTLDYAKQREQFGVPIGSFQAIKHKFADMIVLARTGPRDRLLRRPHDRRGRPPAHDRDVGGQGRGRRLPTAALQGGHPDPRRHRLHVGARHAPLREARQVVGTAVRFEHARTAPASPTCSACERQTRRMISARM